MTVQTNTNVASFNGNGVTQIFPIAFKFNNDTDLVVLLVDDDTGVSTTLTLNSDYTVSGEGDEEGGLINVVVAPAAGQRLKVSRIVDILQLLDLRNQGKFFAEVHEDAFDLLTMIAQQHESGIGSALRVAESDSVPSRLPAAAARANQLLSFDSAGNPIAVAPASGSTGDLAISLAASNSQTKGAGMVGYSRDQNYADGTVGHRLNAVSASIESLAPVESLADMRLLTTPRSVRLVDVNGGWNARSNPTPLGGGAFEWNALSTEADNGGTIIKLNSVETGRLVRVTGADPTCPYWFGALGDGVTDDLSALQAAITWAQDNGGRLHIPGGVFRYSIALSQTKRLHVTGAGRGIGILEYSGSASAYVAEPPTSGESNRFWHWEGFTIRPQTPGSGSYGMYLLLNAGCYMSNFDIHDVEIGDFGNRGIQFDNSVANVDGFFTGSVRRCWVYNGIRGSNMGDSLNFECNTITGQFCGFDFTGLAGARQMIIRENNVTTLGGAIALIGVEQPRIENNQLEHPGYLGPYDGAYGAFVYLANCFKPTLRGNTINPDNGASTVAPAAIVADGTTNRLLLDDNDIQKGAAFHIILAATTSSALIRNTNTYYGAALSIDNSGAGTVIEPPI